MIIYNGKIAILSTTGADFNEEGLPVVTESSLSEPFPCNISGNSFKDNKSNDASYTSASYSVLIDNVSDFYADNVVLYNNRNSRMGTFRVQDIQYLDYVDAVKITCTRYAD